MKTRLALLATLALAIGGCCCSHCDTDDDAVAMNTVNTHCPIGMNAVSADGGTVSFKGHNVGFCCPDCKGDWDAMAEADKDAFIAKAMDIAG